MVLISVTYKKLGDKSFIKASQGRKTSQSKAANESDDDDEEEIEVEVFMNELEYKYESSIYSSSSDESDSSRLSPVPDDANSKPSFDLPHWHVLLTDSLFLYSFPHRSN